VFDRRKFGNCPIRTGRNRCIAAGLCQALLTDRSALGRQCVPAGEQPRFEPIVYGDYLMEQIDKNYQHRKSVLGSA
jgi:hypothetical protein